MLYIGPVEIPGADDHEGYVSGTTADGSRTGIWTDPRGHPVIAYAPACECGWQADGVHPPDPAGYRAAQRTWLGEHFARLAEAAPALRALGRPLDPDTDFLTPAPPARRLSTVTRG